MVEQLGALCAAEGAWPTEEEKSIAIANSAESIEARVFVLSALNMLDEFIESIRSMFPLSPKLLSSASTISQELHIAIDGRVASASKIAKVLKERDEIEEQRKLLETELKTLQQKLQQDTESGEEPNKRARIQELEEQISQEKRRNEELLNEIVDYKLKIENSASKDTTQEREESENSRIRDLEEQLSKEKRKNEELLNENIDIERSLKMEIDALKDRVLNDPMVTQKEFDEINELLAESRASRELLLSETESLHNRISQMESQMSDEAKESQEQQELLTSVEKRLAEALKRNAESQIQQSEMSEKILNYEHEIVLLRKEIDSLKEQQKKQKLEHMRTLSFNPETMKQAAALALQQQQQQQNQMKSGKSSEIERLEREISSLKSQLSKAQITLAAQEQQTAEAQKIAQASESNLRKKITETRINEEQRSIQIVKFTKMLQQAKERAARLNQMTKEDAAKADFVSWERSRTVLTPGDLFPCPLQEVIPDAVYRELNKRWKLEMELHDLREQLMQRPTVEKMEALKAKFAEAVKRAEIAELELAIHAQRIKVQESTIRVMGEEVRNVRHSVRINSPDALKAMEEKLKRMKEESQQPTWQRAIPPPAAPIPPMPVSAPPMPPALNPNNETQTAEQQTNATLNLQETTTKNLATNQFSALKTASNSTLNLLHQTQEPTTTTNQLNTFKIASNSTPNLLNTAQQQQQQQQLQTVPTIAIPAATTTTTTTLLSPHTPKMSAIQADALASKNCTDPIAIISWLSEMGIAITTSSNGGSNNNSNNSSNNDDQQQIWKELSDGVIVLDIIDKMKPGCVNWPSVVRPKSRGKQLHLFQKLANCTMAADLLHGLIPGLKQIEAGDFLDTRQKKLEVVIRELMKWTYQY